MRHPTRWARLGVVAVVGGAALVLVLPTLAAVRPDDRAGSLGAGLTGVASPAVVRPDDRAGIRGVGLVETPVSFVLPVMGPRPDNREGIRGVGPEPFVVSEPSGFDWTDATIGAALGAALVLLVGAAAATLRHRGGPGRPVVIH